MSEEMIEKAKNPVDVIESAAPYVFPGFVVNKESFNVARDELEMIVATEENK